MSTTLSTEQTLLAKWAANAANKHRIWAEETDKVRDTRDGAIRAALAVHVPYAHLGDVTGLSRSMLNLIRRAA